MAKETKPEVLKNEEKELTGNVKVKLKCYKDVKNKDGKIEKKTPDEIVTLPAAEAQKLISKAWAIKV